MLDFVKTAFRNGIAVILWINLILSAIAGGIGGNFVGMAISYREAGNYAFWGVVIGSFWGLLVDVIGGGFITTILSIEKNTEEQTALLKKHLGITDIPVDKVDVNLVPIQENDKFWLTKEMKLYKDEYNFDNVIQLLNVNDVVVFIKQGRTVSIGDTKAPMFYVKTKDGNQGWCFSAYLLKMLSI